MMARDGYFLLVWPRLPAPGQSPYRGLIGLHKTGVGLPCPPAGSLRQVARDVGIEIQGVALLQGKLISQRLAGQLSEVLLFSVTQRAAAEMVPVVFRLVHGKTEEAVTLLMDGRQHTGRGVSAGSCSLARCRARLSL